MDKTKVLESATKLVGKGAFDKAVKEFQRILDVDPDDVRVLQKLAELFQKMNRKAEAAGFKLVDEAKFLRNPDDPRDTPFFKATIPVDGFVLKFTKPCA